MPYYEDMWGNLHYHEPTGTEDQWLSKSEGLLEDQTQAQFRSDVVTEQFKEALSETHRITLKTGQIFEPTPSLPSTNIQESPLPETPRGQTDFPGEGDSKEVSPLSPQGADEMNITLPTFNGQGSTTPFVQGAGQTGFFDTLGNMADLLPLILIMNMSGSSGKQNPLMMILMLSMLGGGGSSGGITAGGLGQIDFKQAMAWSLLPKMGSLSSMLLGGVSAVVGQNALKPKKRSYRKYYPRRRWYGRRR